MTQLQYLEDLIDLKIKAVSDLSRTKRENYERLERKVKRRYKAPSLPAYLLYEYHFKYQDLSKLSSRLGITYSALYTIMYDLEIPLRDRSECQLIKLRIDLEKRVEQEYNIPLKRYLIREYHSNLRSLRSIARELGVSHQTISNIMDGYGIKRRTLVESGELNEGRTYEEIHGAKKAKKIKAKLSGRNNHGFGKSKKARKGRKRKSK
jgi:hypothetical protein